MSGNSAEPPICARTFNPRPSCWQGRVGGRVPWNTQDLQRPTVEEHTMRFRRPSWMQNRRRRLAMKVDRLERLETRNTITEPISVLSMAVTAMTTTTRTDVPLKIKRRRK
jgi:hypothetical protein